MIAILPELRGEIVLARAKALEDCTLNGNLLNTGDVDAYDTWNIDGQWGAAALGAADHRRGWTGFRHAAFDNSTTLDMNSIQTADGLRQLASKIAPKYAGSLAGTVFLACNSTWILGTLMGDSNLVTVDKFGPMATILQGAPMAVWGMPIIPTAFMSADLLSTGLFTGSGATTGAIAFVPSQYRHYLRKSLTIETDVNIRNNVNDIVGMYRSDVRPATVAGGKATAYGFNLTN